MGNFSSFKNAIDSGAVIMTCVAGTSTDYVHNVAIIGYQPNGNFIYMDPASGNLKTAPESSFPKNYVIYVTGTKNQN